jgi:DnaJ-class molecular chaperone
MADTHEPVERPCPSCEGLGQKVNVYVTYDEDDNMINQQVAEMCGTCSGNGVVSY